jgi:hypothetical protein
MKKRAIRIRKPNATKVKKAGAEMDVAYNGFFTTQEAFAKIVYDAGNKERR